MKMSWAREIASSIDCGWVGYVESNVHSSNQAPHTLPLLPLPPHSPKKRSTRTPKYPLHVNQCEWFLLNRKVLLNTPNDEKPIIHYNNIVMIIGLGPKLPCYAWPWGRKICINFLFLCTSYVYTRRRYVYTYSVGLLIPTYPSTEQQIETNYVPTVPSSYIGRWFGWAYNSIIPFFLLL